MKRFNFLNHLAERIEAVERPHPVRVGIDGPDAAGKTVLADDLAANLELRRERADFKRQIIRISLDDYSNPKEIRYDLGRLSPEGYYEEAFNCAAFSNLVLAPLGSGGSRMYMDKIFDFRNNMPFPSIFSRAHDNAILIADGVFLFRPELADKWDYKVFLEVDRQTALDRAMVRDRGYLGDYRMIAETYEKRYFPAQERYQREVDPKKGANLVVDSTDPENPQIISENYLRE
jgi:uridine kinase